MKKEIVKNIFSNQKDNNIYVSTGLNKDEAVLIFKKIAETQTDSEFSY